eukprot:TRINITY_DN400_c0_g1_i2.p1 TRINITY_DN400_c0_g1~~TRINITY_DN400_c0_g1_i2.p1  ORF type:complete len:417 (-),score=94.51 TRINITY_DN400_c0_g1_i2:55-1305(-)
MHVMHTRTQVKIFLGKELKKLSSLRELLSAPRAILTEIERGPMYWCGFCEREVGNERDLFASESAIFHVTSKNHGQHVARFFSDVGGDPALKSSFVLEQTELKKYKETIHRLSLESSACDQPSDLSSFSSSLSSSSFSSPSPTNTLSVSSSSSPFSTSSALPVGPIVRPLSTKKRKAMPATEAVQRLMKMASSRSDCAPMPLLREQDHQGEGEGVGGECSPQFPLPSAIPGPMLSSTTSSTSSSSLLAPAIGPSLRHTSKQPTPISRQTVSASGSGVTRITIRPHSANMYTGAQPPWLTAGEGGGDGDVAAPPSFSDSSGTSHDADTVESEAEIKEYIQQLRVKSSHQKAKEHKNKNPDRVGKLVDRDGIVVGDGGDAGDWLPNFGSVWESGARSKTRKSFRKKVKSKATKGARGE